MVKISQKPREGKEKVMSIEETEVDNKQRVKPLRKWIGLRRVT